MIAAGTTIAHYRVDSLIATGGMGEIYKAVDTRLGRTVALKILPPAVGENRERIRRFVQEAKAASSLSHPNILTVYDAGEAEMKTSTGGDSQRLHFIATELVEGSTLRDLIHRDNVPLKRAVGYLAQAADGLAKAHAAGIVHRDLKPDNIMVTADGFAKVLDFGLAKLVEDENATTATDHTREGVVLGTVKYMSPEQAQGKPVDHRSDIFAFGAIIYEAAARQPPFSGKSDPDILHRIIYEEPAPVPKIPADLDRVMTRALAKNPDERLQSMKDLALELQDISRSYDDLKLVTRIRRRRATHSGAWIALAVLALAAGIVGGRLTNRTVAPDSAPLRFEVWPPENTSFTATPNSATALQFALSPDGKSLAFVAGRHGERPLIWIRELASIKARPLPGTGGALFPFWSPDGSALGFFADGKLKRISTNSDTPIVLADAPDPRGGSWSSRGVIVFAPGAGGTALLRIPAAGGEAVPATTIDQSRGELGHRWPSFLGDGRHFIYLAFGTGTVKRAICVASLDSAAGRFVMAADSRAEYAGKGTIVVMRKGALYAQRVGDDGTHVEGEPVLVEREVGFASPIFFGAFSASHSNAIAWAPWVNPGRRLTSLDRSGKVTGTIFEGADWGAASLSVAGDRAVLTRSNPDTANLDVWQVDLTRGVGSRLTTDPADDNHPVWLADGSGVVFTSTRSGRAELYLKNLADQRETLLPTSVNQPRPTSTTPDGRVIVYFERSPKSGSDIWLLPARPTGTPRPFLATPAAEWGAVVSPDGRWIAYTSNESERDEIYVQPLSGGDSVRVSLGGGQTPKWSADGRELYFMTADAEVSAVSVKGGTARFECSVPSVLFRVPGLSIGPEFQTDYGVTHDGHFLFVLSPERGSSPSIDVAVNWH